MEVHQQPDFLMRQAQIGQKLCFVNWKQFLDCFNFHDDFIFDDEIQPVSTIKLYFFVDNG